MKQIFIITLFCILSTSIFAQSFNGLANIYRGNEKQQTVVYVVLDWHSLCISYPNNDYEFKGVWKQHYETQYRLYISDDMYWQFEVITKQLTLHDTGEDNSAVYVGQ